MWIDIIIFAGVAVFLALRLYSVLGQPGGVEKPPEPSLPPSERRDGAEASVKALPVPEAIKTAASAPAPDSLAGRLHRVQQADANFNEKSFLSGARAAFELILSAFAKGDTATLRPLLEDEVYDHFAEAIRSRMAAKQTLETKISRFKDVEILDADLKLNVAHVTVKFVTEQSQKLTDESGTLVGDSAPQEITDIWTFSRNTRSLDPNWRLSGTRSGE